VKVYARLSLILFLICSVSAGALAIVDAATRGRIQANEEKKERVLRGKALAGEERGDRIVFDPEPIKIGEKKYYAGRFDGAFKGTAFTTSTNKGYSGLIEIVVAMDETGEKIAGIRIKSHSETPGLGANAAQIRYGEIEPWFLAQFSGMGPDRVALKKDDPNGAIDAITAATITSRAVTDCVREGAASFIEVRSKVEEKR
jgi:electron transport complex protein RnfG